MRNKEIHFWSNPPFTNNDIFDFERYVDVADHATDRLKNIHYYDEDTQSIRYPVVFADASPNTMYANERWQRYQNTSDDPKFLTPMFLHHVQPEAKLIAVLRDPVSMVYSGYKYFPTFSPNKPDLTPSDFHNGVVTSVKALLECEQQHSRIFCAYASSESLGIDREVMETCYFVFILLQHGQYDLYISEWLKYFSQEQFLILRMEDIVYEGELDAVARVWDFLGLRPVTKRLQHIYQTMTVSNLAKGNVGDMKEETKEILTEYFKTSTENLSQLLNNDIYLWND